MNSKFFVIALNHHDIKIINQSLKLFVIYQASNKQKIMQPNGRHVI